LDLNEKYAVQGSVHFSAKQIRADRLGAVTRYRQAHYATPALLPVMPQLPADPPAAPRLLGARATPAGFELDWEPGATKPVSWALYRLDGTAATLIATGRTGAKVIAPDAGGYCLAGLDRSGNQGGLSGVLSISP
jgi:hypothetical protein